MKQTLILLAMLAALALTLAACAAQPGPAGNQPGGDAATSFERDESALETIDAEAEAPLAVGPGDQPTPDDDRLVVMDSMLYRGVIDEIDRMEDGGYSLLLSKAAGTNYSFAVLSAVTDEYTRANFEFADLEPGDYIEVYYADSMDGAPVTVIAANKLPDAALCVYNGELVLLERDGEGGGSLELRELGGDSHTVFHFDSSTQFYLNEDDLEPGAALNLFHSGALTRSIPPQGFALEVRKYAAD